MAVGILVTWRVTHLLHAEDGPWNALVRLRRLVRAVGGKLFDCFYCLSLWVAAPFALALGESWEERGLLIPALSAAAILVERVTSPPMPNYVEDSEVHDGLLWKEPNGDGGHSDERSDGS
ncbi:MAG TPA: DUF1360 domain-containing protein [Kofleriaceae bacterium]|nr:DUF1360 domain-containing protein [Kofleriaceae bacterium]